MARRLLQNGYALRVWNRSKEKAYRLEADFNSKVIIDNSPRDVVEGSGITFMMLSTPDACKAVYEGEEGVLAGVSPGKCIVDCATLEPKDMMDTYARITVNGGKFLEAPVSGSKVPAETGQLIFLTAGDKDLYDRCLPYFAVMGKSSHYLGTVGAGTQMKLVVNSIMVNMLAALAEGLSLADTAGLPASSLVQILSEGAINNPMFNAKGPRMISGDHPPNFPLKHAYKDLLFSINMAKSLGIDAKMSEAADELYGRALVEGLGDQDFAAVANITNKK